METKHTPGPWRHIQAEHGFSAHILGADGSIVLADGYDSGDPVKSDHDRALMAAAPMMLERLMQIAGFYEYEPAGPAAYGARLAVAEALGIPDWKPKDSDD